MSPCSERGSSDYAALRAYPAFWPAVSGNIEADDERTGKSDEIGTATAGQQRTSRTDGPRALSERHNYRPSDVPTTDKKTLAAVRMRVEINFTGYRGALSLSGRPAVRPQRTGEGSKWRRRRRRNERPRDDH